MGSYLRIMTWHHCRVVTSNYVWCIWRHLIAMTSVFHGMSSQRHIHSCLTATVPGVVHVYCVHINFFDMVYKCCMVGCGTGLTNKPEGIAVFGFPDKEEDPDRWRAWVRFVNRKNFEITNKTKICELHFEDRFIRRGERTTLVHRLHPVPSIESYSENVPPSIKPSPSPPARKPPTQRRGPNSPAEDRIER